LTLLYNFKPKTKIPWTLFQVITSFHCTGTFNGSTTLVGLDLLIVEASRSQSDTPHAIGLLWTSNQPVAETSM